MQIRLDFSPEQNLRSLCALRGCAVLGLLAAVIVVDQGLGLALPVRPMLALASGLTLWCLFTLWRLSRRWPVTQAEIFAHLLLDSLALTALYGISGGAGNPFISFYLVPIAIAAVMLPRAWAWALTLGCMLLYGGLVAGFTQHAHGHAGGHGFQLHVLGMWLNFLLSAVLVTIFVTATAEAARRRDRSLAAAREEALRNEQILAVGTLAAGAAHELSTPLSTMAITLDELRETHRGQSSLQADLDLLSQQIVVCREQLDLLLSIAGQPRAGQTLAVLALDAFLRQCVDRCRLLRPEITLEARLDANLATVLIRHEPTLAQALLAALNNAADASLANRQSLIRMSAACADGLLKIEVSDRGPGLRPEQLARAGRGLFTTKHRGYGLGLVLSHATLERLGGEMQLENLTEGGTLARITLPLTSLQPASPATP